MKKTIVIAIEGIDGSGKTAQVNRLRESLSRRGLKVVVRSYPVYESYFGAQIGRLLSGAEGITADSVDSKSMALWFALDRWDDMKTFTDGEADVLLINRYTLSNAVYQSIRESDLGKPDILDWVFDLEFVRLGIPVPDVNIVLDVEPMAAGINVDKKGFRCYVGDCKDVYEADKGIQYRAREKYLEYACRRDDILVVSCMENGKLLDEQTVADRVEAVLKAHNII